MSTKIYTVYSEEGDMTFIMEDVLDGENPIATECKGFYYGEPDAELTREYYGHLSAMYS